MEDGTPSAALLMLDPRTRAYITLPTLPVPAIHADAAVVAGRMYVLGGLSVGGQSVSSLQRYDMPSGRWGTSCAPMAEARHSHGVAALHGEVWSVGGQDDDELASVEVYSPQLNTWRAGVALPHSCFDGTCDALVLRRLGWGALVLVWLGWGVLVLGRPGWGVLVLGRVGWHHPANERHGQPNQPTNQPSNRLTARPACAGLSMCLSVSLCMCPSVWGRVSPVPPHLPFTRWCAWVEGSCREEAATLTHAQMLDPHPRVMVAGMNPGFVLRCSLGFTQIAIKSAGFRYWLDWRVVSPPFLLIV